MAKVQIKSEKLTPFGGIFSIMEQFDSMLSPIIDQTLGQRCRSIIGYQYSVNFPRMRPAQNEGFQPNCFMTDKQLAQATFAMRIFDHDVDISYSTREPAYIRDNMATLGVTTMSAESKVNPGGYHTYPQDRKSVV